MKRSMMGKSTCYRKAQLLAVIYYGFTRSHMSVVRLRYRPAAVQPELAVVKGEVASTN